MSLPLWDNEREGLTKNWIWVKGNSLEVTLIKENWQLKDKIIKFVSNYSQDYYQKVFDNNEVIKLFFPYKENINLPTFLKAHPNCQKSIPLFELISYIDNLCKD